MMTEHEYYYRVIKGRDHKGKALWVVKNFKARKVTAISALLRQGECAVLAASEYDALELARKHDEGEARYSNQWVNGKVIAVIA